MADVRCSAAPAAWATLYLIREVAILFSARQAWSWRPPIISPICSGYSRGDDAECRVGHHELDDGERYEPLDWELIMGNGIVRTVHLCI